jgi:hypothetical protein
MIFMIENGMGFLMNTTMMRSRRRNPYLTTPSM